MYNIMTPRESFIVFFWAFWPLGHFGLLGGFVCNPDYTCYGDPYESFFFDQDEWRFIQDYDDYMISASGVVYNVRTDRYLKRGVTPEGYLVASLSRYGVAKRHFIHRLVGEAFVPGETLEKYWVNHIDLNKGNTHFLNLEWVTPAENSFHADQNGAHRGPPLGSCHPRKPGTKNFSYGGV